MNECVDCGAPARLHRCRECSIKEAERYMAAWEDAQRWAEKQIENEMRRA